MSKYIKTENGIYEVINVEYNEDIDMNQYFIKDNKHFNEHEIIKQADTIEELCDEFILDHPLFSCKTLYHSFKKAKKGINKRSGDTHDLNPFTIYGSIWTDKGLIYVAKLNNDGELELI